MEVAKDRRTGRHVLASEGSYYNDYRCPVCNAEVFLRRGEHRIAHFAHKSGLALPECELYFAPNDIKHPWTIISGAAQSTAGRENHSIPALSIAIELESADTQRRNQLRRWGLRLVIPRSDGRLGQMQVDTGEHFRKIALSSLFVGPTALSANPESLDFGATWFSPEVSVAYRTALAERIPGLSADGITVFASLADKQKPRVKVLAWGANYYFVWNGKAAVDIPRSILTHRLSDHGSWNCVLVTLPIDADEKLEAWINDACGLQVLTTKRAWGIVYPVAYDIDVGGRILASPNDTVLITTRNVGDSLHETSEFECAAEGAHSTISMPNNGTHLLEVRADDEHRDKPLAFIWDKKSLPSLVRVAYDGVSEMPCVTLRFRSLADGELRPEKLHTRDCREALRMVRARQLDLESIQAPKGMSGSIAWRHANQFDWQRANLNSPLEDVRTKSAVNSIQSDAAKISTVLKNEALEVVLSFDSFGEFYASAYVKIAASATKPAMRPELRTRIAWFCKMSQSANMMATCAADDLADGDLIAHFLKLKTPAWLIAHRRSIESALHGASRGAVER